MNHQLKLFMVLLGANPKGRTVEQHDYFFGIAQNLEVLIPQMKAFWPEAENTLHIDGWREITQVEGYQVTVVDRNVECTDQTDQRLFFINLGGYQTGKLEEQHYHLLMVGKDRKQAIKQATGTEFFRFKGIPAVKSASAHIDEKYGIDVDDCHRIEDVLSTIDKFKYRIILQPKINEVLDEVHLGYTKIASI